jgi:hypothetical protein
MDPASEFCYIAPFRNFLCEFYGFCLDKHALRDRGRHGWNCLDCDHVSSREEIDAEEPERAALLLAEVYQVDRACIIRRRTTGTLVKREGRLLQIVEG